MKQFRLLLFILGGAFLAASCSDDFSEEDLLNAQNAQIDSLKADNIRALNEAGELVGLQLRVVNTDGVGVADLEVTIAAALGSGGLDEQTTTTNGNGVALFDKVAIGGNSISISGGTILPVLLDADFGSINEGTHYEIINGAVIPTPVTESAIITVLGASSETATVQGNVQIETDLTNTAPEIPQNVTIVADFDDGLSFESSFNIDYFFATNNNVLNIGTATVDATSGNYSMTVPAGVRFDIIVPNVTVTQRMAVASVSGVDLDMPEYRDVDASFGPSFGTSGIPFVRGARIVFDEPQAGGSGFTLSSFARVPRDRGDTFFGVPTTKSDEGSEVWQFTNLGAGYTGSPVVTITDATAINTYAEAHVAYAITGLTIADAGTGFTDGVTYNFDVYYDEIEDAGDGTTVVDPDQINTFGVISIEADASGGFIAADVNAALQDAIDNNDFFFDPSSLVTIADNVSNLRLVSDDGTTDAVLTVSSAVSRVRNFSYTGEDFTNPTFAFSGGGGTTQATATVEWASQWTFDLDNTNSADYNAVPDIFFELDDADVPMDKFTSANVDQLDANGNVVTTNDIVNFLAVDGGIIVLTDPTSSLRTNSLSVTEPVAIITEPSAGQAATARVNINNDGQVTGLSSVNTGSGYISEFGATIMPGADSAPGSGATVRLFEGQFNADGTYSWFGNFTITNQGSGYVPELNVINDNGGTRSYTDGNPSNITLRAGDTYVFNIDYGTGFRSVTYGGTP